VTLVAIFYSRLPMPNNCVKSAEYPPHLPIITFR